MTTPLLDNTHGRTTSGVTCHHRLGTAHTVERRRLWHAIIAFGLADTVVLRQAWHAIIALGRQTWSNDVGRGMPSSSLGSIDDRTALGVACNHRLWPAHTVERRQAWHAIIAFGIADKDGRRRAWHAIIALGQETRSNEVGHGMQSSPLGSTDSRTASGVA